MGERGSVTCTPVEWGGSLGPELMLFKPQTSPEFEIWSWDYFWNDIPAPTAVCNGDIWYQNNDMGAGFHERRPHLLHSVCDLLWRLPKELVPLVILTQCR